MKGFLIVNPRSGDGTRSVDELCAAARARGLACHVLAEGDDLAAVARAARADAIGMAGGDGSLATVALAAVERDVPFVCVPFGTRNHFAGDLGLDREDPLGALSAFDSRTERRVDLARINDRAFLNNASLGAYADLVRRREHHRRRNAAFARMRAIGRSALDRRRLPLLVDDQPFDVRALMVGNNAYQLTGLNIGARDRLDEGLLHVYLSEGLVPLGLTELPSRAEVNITSASPRLTVALDGEPAELATPLHLSAQRRALRVLLPELRR